MCVCVCVCVYNLIKPNAMDIILRMYVCVV